MLRTRNFPLLSWIWRQISHFGDHFSFLPQLFHHTNLSQSNTSSGELVEVAERESRTRYRTAFMSSLIHWLGLRFYETGWTKFQNHFTVLNVAKLRPRNFKYFVKLDRKYHFHHSYSATASKPSLRFRRSIHFLWLVKQNDVWIARCGESMIRWQT